MLTTLLTPENSGKINRRKNAFQLKLKTKKKGGQQHTLDGFSYGNEIRKQNHKLCGSRMLERKLKMTSFSGRRRLLYCYCCCGCVFFVTCLFPFPALRSQNKKQEQYKLNDIGRQVGKMMREMFRTFLTNSNTITFSFPNKNFVF